jgi:hypothetical protein
MNKTVRYCAALLLVGAMSACGSSSDSPSPSGRSVTISWTQNRETGVNKAGGGYLIGINTQTPIEVPYVSGTAAPTSYTLTLQPGSYTITVVAYAALDTQGGTTRTPSKPSTPYTLTVQ